MRLKDKSTSISSTNNEAREIIKTFNKAIKDILIELSNFSDEQINFNNQEKIKELLIRADDTINGCDTTKYFNCSKNPNFSILVYKYQRLTIKYTIVDPEFIYKSKRYENREVFFKQGSHSNPSYNKLYTKAVVEYVENTGKITTAFLCKDIQGVDERGIKYVNINNKL